MNRRARGLWGGLFALLLAATAAYGADACISATRRFRPARSRTGG